MSATDVTLQLGRHDLLERVEPLWLALFDAHEQVGHAGLPLIPREASWPLRQRHYEHLLEDPRTFVLIASDDIGDVGYAVGRVHDGADDTWPTSDPQGEIESLCVVERARGAGIGTRLLDAAESRLASLGGTSVRIVVMAGNTAAYDFYANRDMTPIATTLMRLTPRAARPSVAPG
jgi:ribosomal protein S18 acetylase RimI-like enzyme